MAGFVFRAAAALDLRRRKEDLARQAWADACSALERAERQLAAAQDALAQTLVEAATVHDPARQAWYRAWITRQRVEITHRRSAVEERRAAREAAVLVLNAAHRDVRALERLRDRTRAAWQLAQRRAEQKELDWLGSVRYALREIE